MIPAISFAATTTIEAVADFITGITLDNEVDMDFGTVEYTATAGSTATLGTNGTVTYAGGFSGNGTGAAGQVRASGDVGADIEVRCDTSAILTNDDVATINAVNIAVSFTPGTHAAASLCNGVGGAVAATHTLDANPANNVMYFGGILDGNTVANFIPDSYSTANGGGDDIEILVTYQ
jgi:hypothetical protein